MGSVDSARLLWKAGENRDGYFTSGGILAQDNCAMDILNKEYPHDTHVFFYNNVKTHRTHQPDALSA
jgi:hypothetical protein